MPRHRIEAQRPRTLWPAAGQTARRVPVHAAGRRAKPGHAKEAVVPEWRQQLARNQRRMLKRAGRGLLVSPWFAAGAGVVIATGAVVYVPHANLDFGGAIQVTHCKQALCDLVTEQGGAPGLPAGTGGGPLRASPNPLAGFTFSYQLLGDSAWDGFSMLITIHGPRSLGQWKLSFVILGATDVVVVNGARWQPSGTDGGTASNYYSGTESAGYASISGHQSWSSRDSDTVQLQVRGKGVPSPPTNCFYDGTACHFQRSYSQAGANWSTTG